MSDSDPTLPEFLAAYKAALQGFTEDIRARRDMVLRGEAPRERFAELFLDQLRDARRELDTLIAVLSAPSLEPGQGGDLQ